MRGKGVGTGLLLALGGCAGPNAAADLPRGEAAYRLVPPARVGAPRPDYRIGPLDTIDVVVFQEPDLSAKAVRVDAAGQVALPLVGALAAAGRTPAELARVIEDRLGARYLQHPQVSVLVVTPMSQKVVVEGEVVEPGVYPLHGPTSLLEALSLAKGETRVAALKEVLVFRMVDGRRAGAVFDVARIRRGGAADPEILGNDLVVVGYSNARGAWRDFLQASPFAAALRPF